MPKRQRIAAWHASSAQRASGCAAPRHMFFEASRISLVRQMILADDEAGRRRALEQLLPEQRADFTAIFVGNGRSALHESGCSIRRCTNSCRTPTRTSPNSPMPPGWGSIISSGARGRASTNSTRCWAIADAGWGLPSPKSTKCRHAPFSKRFARSSRQAARRRFRKS